jgi:hypothetical protein
MKKALNQIVLEELRTICEANPEKLLKPEAVVQAAQNPESPLHEHFTWDNDEAAAKYRLEEARTLIREVHLEYDKAWMRGPVPAFVSLSEDRGNRDGGGYRQTPQVLTNPQLRKELAATANRELASWARRHKMLKGLCLAVLDAAGIPASGVFTDHEISLALAEQAQENGNAA